MIVKDKRLIMGNNIQGQPWSCPGPWAISDLVTPPLTLQGLPFKLRVKSKHLNVPGPALWSQLLPPTLPEKSRTCHAVLWAAATILSTSFRWLVFSLNSLGVRVCITTASFSRLRSLSKYHVCISKTGMSPMSHSVGCWEDLEWNVKKRSSLHLLIIFKNTFYFSKN